MKNGWFLHLGSKDNWDAQRHVDYIVELQNNGNADNVQFLLTYTGNLEESIDVIISLERTVVICFRIKSIEEKEREYLAANWQDDLLAEVHDKVENNNPIEDAYVEGMLLSLKPFDHDSVESLMKIHENYKSNR